MRPFRKKNRSAFLNFIRAKYEMYTGAVQLQSLPYLITTDPSDRCQLRCGSCPTGVENEMRLKQPGAGPIFRTNRAILSSELFDAVMDEMGEYCFHLLLFDFGEPLLNVRLAEFIAKANARDIVTDVNTNLSLKLSDRRIDELLLSGLDYLNVSIDGFSQETYVQHRVGGDFALVINNLERFIAARARLGVDTAIYYNFLVFGFNEHEVPAARAYCERLGIGFSPRDAFIHRQDWLPSYRKDQPGVVVPEEHQYPEEFQPRKGGVAMAWSPFLDTSSSACPSRCSWHYCYSIITAGGPVAPCSATAADKYDFGTVVPGRVRFADVWNNKRCCAARAHWAGKPVPETAENTSLCVRCPFPRWVQHNYSLHDMMVMAQYFRVLGGRDAVLDEAFHRLATLRYGPKAQFLFRPDFDRNEWLQIQLAGGNESYMTPFTEFYERHLLHSATPPPAQLAGAPNYSGA
jgi:MoaA/NifB/PqqE/SkfB family radical SAM enzyme